MRRVSGHHLDGAAGQPEGQRPQARLLRHSDEVVRLGQEDILYAVFLGETQERYPLLKTKIGRRARIDRYNPLASKYITYEVFGKGF
jgi:hypothetical protein